jgi:hypothetical protein
MFGSSTVSWRLNEKSSEIIEKKIYRFYTDFFPLDFSFKRQDTVGQAMQLIILE